MLNTIHTWLTLHLLRSSDEELGQGLVEYSLILMLVALLLIVIVATLGVQVNNLYSNVSNGLAN